MGSGHFFNQRAFHPAPMAHDKVFNWNPVLRGEANGLNDSDTVSAIFTGGYTFNKSLARVRASQAADDARRREMTRQQGIDDNIAQLRTQYGVGDSAEAQYNHGVIGNWLDSYQNDLLHQSNTDIAHARSSDELGTRQRLASQGLLGGSVDVQARRAALSRYVSSRQQAVAGAQGARQDLEGQMTQQRQGLEKEFAAGTAADPTWSDVSAQQSQLLDGARRNIVPSAVGGALGTAGSLYEQDQTARGNGRSGFTWGRGSTAGASTGSIT